MSAISTTEPNLIEPLPRSSDWTLERDTPAKSARDCCVSRSVIRLSAKTSPMRAISGIEPSRFGRLRLGPTTYSLRLEFHALSIVLCIADGRQAYKLGISSITDHAGRRRQSPGRYAWKFLLKGIQRRCRNCTNFGEHSGTQWGWLAAEAPHEVGEAIT